MLSAHLVQANADLPSESRLSSGLGQQFCCSCATGHLALVSFTHRSQWQMELTSSTGSTVSQVIEWRIERTGLFTQ
jgi:hypothetical protein